MTRTYAFHLFGPAGESCGQVTAPFLSDAHARAAARQLVADPGLQAVHVSRGGIVLFTVPEEKPPP